MTQVNLSFPDKEIAVAQMPTCRMATQLREFFFIRGYHMERQTSDGQLILRVPMEPVGPPDNHRSHERVSVLFKEFCRRNSLQPTG